MDKLRWHNLWRKFRRKSWRHFKSATRGAVKFRAIFSCNSATNLSKKTIRNCQTLCCTAFINFTVTSIPLSHRSASWLTPAEKNLYPRRGSNPGSSVRCRQIVTVQPTWVKRQYRTVKLFCCTAFINFTVSPVAPCVDLLLLILTSKLFSIAFSSTSGDTNKLKYSYLIKTFKS